MTRRPLSFALVPVLLGTQLASAEAQTPAPTQPARPSAQAAVPAQPGPAAVLPPRNWPVWKRSGCRSCA